MLLLLVVFSYLTVSTLGACTADTKLLRKEWRQLTRAEQQEYISAELCLQSLPSRTGIPGVVTRFDDLQAIHQVQSSIIHNVGQFLPFHRIFVRLHEELLRDECGYKGAQPWWDESLDDGHYIDSPLLTPEAFGGDGTDGSGCVIDGPFANYTLHLGPGDQITDHCLVRSVNNPLGSGTFFVQKALNATTFDLAATYMTKVPGPHAAGHTAIGGEMANPISSPGDPIFFLHHAWLDRIWWNWQARNLSTRLTEISGYTTVTLPFIATTLDYSMNLFGIRPNVTITEVMDISGDRICVGYT